MAQVLCQLPNPVSDENLLVGIETSDDAAVYKINDDQAVVITIDFFTPVVDDPFVYGQIGAANSLSDVYAMGTDPKLAMNLIGFPNCLKPEVMAEILKGGHDKIVEAGALLVGGHTVQDDEPKYGLCAIGFMKPEDVMKNSEAKPGDVLVITKAIGVGIINAGIKGGIVEKEVYDEAVHNMRTLNKYAKDAMMKVGANACTDVTGFGLLGHALEMAEGSEATLVLYSDKIPMMQGAIDLAMLGLVPEGTYANERFIGDKVRFADNVKREHMDIMFDPQTSGGLLISLPEEKVDELLKELEGLDTKYAVIGKVTEKQDKYLIVE